MKGVSLIIQFVLFFTIGLAFYLLIGNLFRFQLDLIKRDILDASSDLETSQMAAAAIAAVDTCKSCDNNSVKVELKTIVSYNPSFTLSGQGVTLSIDPENKVSTSSSHNLNSSISYVPRTVTSLRPITLTYDKTKSNLVIK